MSGRKAVTKKRGLEGFDKTEAIDRFVEEQLRSAPMVKDGAVVRVPTPESSLENVQRVSRRFAGVQIKEIGKGIKGYLITLPVQAIQTLEFSQPTTA